MLSITNYNFKNIIRACISGILGSLLWISLKENCDRTMTINVPLVIGHRHSQDYIAQSDVSVTIKGNRATIYNFLHTNPMLCIDHVDHTTLKYGLQEITISEQQLHLPATLRLINYATIPVFINSEK